MTTYTDAGDIDLDEVVVTGKDGQRITEADADAAAAEFEKARGGRPSLTGAAGSTPALAVRVDPEVRDLLLARAEREGKTLSAVAREALEAYARTA
ncbi:MAG: hypothetical protein QM621_08165 [Aeromicrobium sp.]|uniref:hypothetical protein n=1 Tax=Aeromicrobium sp. TaxID=1871063 RepID=UPI0039E42DAF